MEIDNKEFPEIKWDEGLNEEEKEELLKAAQPYGETLSPAERKERMIRLIMRALDKTYDEAVKMEKEFSKMSDLKRARKRNSGF